MTEIVGRVVEIMRYPVKSMAGEQLAAADVDWQGIEGDRQYAFYHQDNRSRFPWLTGRDLSELVRYVPRFRDPEAPKTSPVDVLTPDGRSLLLDGPELLAGLTAASGSAVALIQLGRGCHDAMPVSVVTTATHAMLDASHGAPLNRRRFRSNIVIEASVRETEWHARRLVFGEGAELLLAEGAPRCAMVTIDPDTAERNPKVLRTVAQDYDNRIAVYASTARQGQIRVGDPVSLAD